MASPAIRSLMAGAMLAVTAATACTAAVSDAEPTLTPVRSVGTPLASAPPAGTFGLEGWERDPQVQALYQRALAEGEVRLYSERFGDPQSLCQAFMERFPGIRCVASVFTQQTITGVFVIETVVEEHQGDVLAASMPVMLDISERGYLPTVDWGAFGVEPGRTGGTRPWLEARHDIYGHSFNADHVARVDLPRTVDDLLSPRWRGLMVTSLNGSNRWLAYLALDRGYDRALELGRYLRDDQELLITRSYQLLLQQGERVLAIALPRGAVDPGTDGLGVEPFVLDFVPLNVTVAAPVVDAPHPDAARLLALFMLSEEGWRWLNGRPLAPYGFDPAQTIAERYPNATVLRVTPEVLSRVAAFEERLRQALR